jgi:hypothetical protein
MNFKICRKAVVVFLIPLLAVLLIIFETYNVQKQGLFVISTTLPLFYLIYIEILKHPSKFIKFCLLAIVVIHIFLNAYAIKHINFDFLNRTYNATGVSIIYFTSGYFIVWILKCLQHLFVGLKSKR